MALSRVPLDVTRQKPALATHSDIVDLTTPATSRTYTVPSDADEIEIKFTHGVLWMKPGATATIPSGNVTNGSASELVGWGQSFTVTGGQQISFINADACLVNVIPRKN